MTKKDDEVKDEPESKDTESKKPESKKPDEPKDGEVDGDAVASAIDKLITDEPYLAAQGTRFKGEADGGARKEPPADLDGQIAAATAAGQHQLAIALKQQRAALAAHKS